MLGLLVAIDSCWYGKPTIVPIHFVLFNFVNNFSQFYGEHPWHWYLTNALPSIFGPTLLPLLLSFQFLKSIEHTKKRTVFTILLSIALYVLCHRYKCPKKNVIIRTLVLIFPFFQYCWTQRDSIFDANNSPYQCVSSSSPT